MNDNDENRPVPVPEHYLEVVRSIYFFFSLFDISLLASVSVHFVQMQILKTIQNGIPPDRQKPLRSHVSVP